ncbi:hypothetical protein [Labrenzia sp. PHM005]|uniref:hypothetical protein n=1 Tax=Labrenzia sp. PHM005 TaxID=2590016 RepID=UPI001140361E|nr:hypothetical protein [Labrenzia sp. PHM005]QDG77816.1 hypothetical protein FJ695_19205 [Labrenzia sp. PHM005]
MSNPRGAAAVEPAVDLRNRKRQTAIAETLTGFIEDLKLVDVLDFAAYIRLEQHANIADLVKTSAELFFKEDTLRYSMAGQADLDWATRPQIKLDLEFLNKGVWIYFTVILASPDNSVTVSYVEVPDAGGDPVRETELMLEALKDARLK